MQMCRTTFPAMRGQQIHQHRVIKAELTQKHVGTGHPQYLRRTQAFKHLGNIFANTKSIYRDGTILSQHLLGEHQVSQI